MNVVAGRMPRLLSVKLIHVVFIITDWARNHNLIQRLKPPAMAKKGSYRGVFSNWN